MVIFFDVMVRINLDICVFVQGVQVIIKFGGQMEKVFQNLNIVMSKVVYVDVDFVVKI